MADAVASAGPGSWLTSAIEGFRRSRLKVGLAALICGIGLATSGVTLVRAADDSGLFGFLSRSAFSRLIDPIRLRPRYDDGPGYVYRPGSEVRRREERRRVRNADSRDAAARQAQRRGPNARLARPAAGDPSRPGVRRQARVKLAGMAGAVGRRTMCVRTCDGYMFPLGMLHSRGDIGLHRTACAAACPGAETSLYTLAAGQALEKPDSARSVDDGSPYVRLKSAYLFRSRAVASCACQTPATMATHLPILLDPTLRRGDVVVDGNGDAKAYAGGGGRAARNPKAFGDYEGSGALSRRTKAQVDRVMGTSVRRKIAADYERSERQRLAALKPNAPLRDLADVRPTPVRQAAFREVAAPAGSGSGIRAYSANPQGGVRHPSGAQIYTIQ